MRTWHLLSKLTHELFPRFPFGTERIPVIFKYALSPALCAAPTETFVTTDSARARVRVEYRCWVVIYALLVVIASDPLVARWLWTYWLLPYTIGCAHLRFYQTAEHRACNERDYTDTTVWIASRTTSTFWLYARLAWNMPYHAEHHAWPNIPFHRLPALHEVIKKRHNGVFPKSNCNPDGSSGYLGLHRDILNCLVATFSAPAEATSG